MNNETNLYRRLLHMLENGITSVSHNTDEDDDVRKMLQDIGETFSCRRVYIYVRKEDGSYSKINEWHEAHTAPAPVSFSATDGEEIFRKWHHLTDKDIIELKDIHTLKQDHITDILKKCGIQTAYFGILRNQGKIIGLVGAENPNWDDQEAMYSVFHICTSIAAAKIRTSNELRKAEETSTRDPLTGLGNRLGLNQYTARLSHNTSLGIVYGDLTGLKATNDRYGHDSGDSLLRETAGILQKVFGSDSSFRIGGDEFTALSAGKNVDEFNNQIRKLNELCEEAGIVFPIGTVYENPWQTDFEILMRHADSLMYANKRKWYSNKEETGSHHEKDRSLELIAEIYPNNDLYQVLYQNDEGIMTLPGFGRLSEIGSYIEKIIYPGDLASFQSFCNAENIKERVLQNDAGSMEMQKEFRVSTRNGEWNWIRLSLILTNPDEEDFRVLCFVRNLSAQHNAEIDRMRQNRSHGLKDYEVPGMEKDQGILRRINLWMTKQEKNHAALLYFDMKSFLLYNAVFGKEAGDDLLRKFHQELQAYVEERQGICGYYGVDEFVAAIKCDEQAQRLETETTSWLKNIDIPDGFRPTCGAVIFNGDSSISELFYKAEMSEDKIHNVPGKLVHVYRQTDFEKIQDEQRLISDVYKAVQTGEMTFYLQPKVNMENGRIVSAEALARWIHDGHMIAPDSYIPLLERQEQIYPLDKYIWEKVFAFQRSLIKQNIRPLSISVNVSQKDIKAGNIVKDFEDLQKKYAVDPSLIGIEITESAYAENEDVRRVTFQLNGDGFKILMDDFGKGYSSLSAFDNMPVDILKIDKKFVDKVLNDPKDEEIVSLIIRMAHMVGIHVVAEGVESAEQVRKMLRLNAHYAQGYYFYKPIPQDQYTALIKNTDNVQYDPKASGRRSVGYLNFSEMVRSNVINMSEAEITAGPLSIWQVLDDHLILLQMNQRYAEIMGLDFERVTPDQNVAAFMEDSMEKAVQNFHEARKNGYLKTEGWYRRPSDGKRILLKVSLYPMNERLNGDLYLVQLNHLS